MQEATSELNEKSLEIILNFKPQEKFDKTAQEEIIKLRSQIQKIISLLPKDEQEIIEFRYFQNLTVDNISQKTSKPKEEVINTISKAVDKIKKNIKEVPKLEPTNNKQLTSPPQVSSAKASFIAGFISLIFFIFIFAGSYFLIQKLFSNQMPRLGLVISDFADETFSRGLPWQVPTKRRASYNNPNDIKISGSTSLLALTKQFKKAFNVKSKNYHVKLISSDSDQGISDLIEGKVDIANSSRPVTFLDEKRASNKGLGLAENRIALDALIIIVNNKNLIDELTLDDLEKIFSGEIKDWQELNNKASIILPVIREKGSGTNDFVLNRILQGNNFSSSAIKETSNKDLINFISQNDGAIGFTNSTNYPWKNKNIKYLKIRNYDNSLSVSPFEDEQLNEQAIRYGDYPLAHYLYLITLANPEKKVKEFLDWVLSKKGQKIVRDVGLIPVTIEEEQ